MEYQGALTPGGEPLSEEVARKLAREAMRRADDPWYDLRHDVPQADSGHHLEVPRLDFTLYGHAEPRFQPARSAPAPYTRIPSSSSRLPSGVQLIATRTARAWLRTEHYFIIGLMVLVLVGAGMELLGQSA